MTWDLAAQGQCRQLQQRYGHQCLQDMAHKVGPAGEADGGGGAAAFHSAEFVAIGFAKIKYLINSLSLGYDVMAMDADVVVLRSPFPSLLPLRPHLAVLTEKCEVVDMAQPLQPWEGGLADKERYMAALLEGHAAGEARVIKNTKKIIKRNSLRHRHRHRR
eukprot:XP_001701902.1 predicted protein [Chlamydomonas reinhardtii]